MGWKDTIQNAPTKKSWRDTIQDTAQPPGEAESVGRGLAKGGTFGFEPELAGAGGVLGDQLGRMGVDPVQSTHPDVQAKLDAIAQTRTPTASSIYDKTKNEEIASNDLAQKANPNSFLGAELLGGGVTGKAALGALGSAATQAFPAVQDIPVGLTLKTAGKLIPGAEGYISKASQTMSDFSKAVQANRAARLGEKLVETGEEVSPIVREQIKKAVQNSLAQPKFDPFTKQFIQP